MQKIATKGFILAVICLFGTVDSLKILFMAPFPVPSHWFWLNSVVEGLLDRGHEVTAITNFPAKKPHLNYTEIILDPPYDLLKYCKYVAGRTKLNQLIKYFKLNN